MMEFLSAFSFIIRGSQIEPNSFFQSVYLSIFLTSFYRVRWQPFSLYTWSIRPDFNVFLWITAFNISPTLPIGGNQFCPLYFMPQFHMGWNTTTFGYFMFWVRLDFGGVSLKIWTTFKYYPDVVFMPDPLKH